MEDSELIGIHQYAGNITVTINKNCGTYKLDFNTGNVNFNGHAMPEDWRASYSRSMGGLYDKIPMLFYRAYSYGESYWWFNFSIVTKSSHKLEDGYKINGNSNGFTLYTSKEKCETFMIGLKMIVDKLVEIGYIKEKALEGTYTINDCACVIKKIEEDQYRIEFTGIKKKEEYLKEYVDSYPMIYKDVDTGFYCIRDFEGMYLGTGYKEVNEWTILLNNKQNKEYTKIILDIFKASMERLSKINNKTTTNGDDKEMTEETIVFNGLGQYQECVKYDINGCMIMIKKTDDVDKYEINLDVYDYDFKVIDHCISYAKINNRIELDNAHALDNTRFFAFVTDHDYVRFKNGDKLTVDDINKVMKCINGATEYFKSQKDDKPIKEKKKVELMTKEEMLKLLKENKKLASEISLEKWERVREYVIENNLSYISSGLVGSSSNCALCYVYSNGEKKCERDCPLYKTIGGCGSNGYDFAMSLHDTNKQLVNAIDAFIDELKQTIEYEKKELRSPLTVDEMNELLKTKTPAEVSLIKWEKLLKIAKADENITTYDELNSGGWRTSALCDSCDGDCSTCMITKYDRDEECTKDGSYYSDIKEYYDDDHDEFVSLIEDEVEFLKQVVKFEKQYKEKKFEIELPEERKVYNFSGIKVAVKYMENFEKYKLSIDSNGWDLDSIGSERINFDDTDISFGFWVDQGEEYDWYISRDFVDKYITDDDDTEFDDGKFDNGIMLNEDNMKKVLTVLKLFFEKAKEKGNLKKIDEDDDE